MAQIRFHNYQRPLVSFDENMRALGFVGPGRVCGFDTMSIVGGNTLAIAHTATGVKPTLLDGTGGTLRGVVQSRQGNFIQEDAAININVDFNVANANDRIDLLIMQHSFIDSVGGAAAVYSIIKGVLTGAEEPALSDPLTQVLIGKFLIKAAAANHVNTVYEPVDPFLLGGGFGISKKSDRDVQDISNLVNPGRIVAGAQTNSDFNRMTKSGLFRIVTITNRPSAFATEWFVLISSFVAFVVQLALSKDGKAYTRCSLDSGATWTTWEHLNNSDLGDLNYSSNTYVTDGDNFTVAIGKLDAAIGTAVAGLLDFKGNIDASVNPNYLAALKGDSYVITVAGKVGGAGGKAVDVGDFVVAKADNAGGDEAAVGVNWFVIEHNLERASQGEVNAGLEDTKYITAAKIKNATQIIERAAIKDLAVDRTKVDNTVFKEIHAPISCNDLAIAEISAVRGSITANAPTAAAGDSWLVFTTEESVTNGNKQQVAYQFRGAAKGSIWTRNFTAIGAIWSGWVMDNDPTF